MTLKDFLPNRPTSGQGTLLKRPHVRNRRTINRYKERKKKKAIRVYPNTQERVVVKHMSRLKMTFERKFI